MNEDISAEFQFIVYLTIKVYVVEYASQKNQVLLY